MSTNNAPIITDAQTIGALRGTLALIRQEAQRALRAAERIDLTEHRFVAAAYRKETMNHADAIKRLAEGALKMFFPTDLFADQTTTEENTDA